jgi:hypothetical protein
MSKKTQKKDLRNLFILTTLASYSYFIILFKYEDYQFKPFASVFGLFLACSIPPIVCWVTYAIILFVQKEKIKNLTEKSINKIDTSTEYSKEFKTSFDALNDLLFVKAITIEEFENKKKLLIRKIDTLVNQTENLKMNQMQVEKLNNARNLGVISEEEYYSKIKKLSDEEVAIKQQIESIKSN